MWISQTLADDACRDFSVPAPDLGQAKPSWEGIRPGTWLVGGCLPAFVQDGPIPYGGCTFNWVFRFIEPDGRAVRRALGTAAHCFTESDWTSEDYQSGRKVIAFVRDTTDS